MMALSNATKILKGTLFGEDVSFSNVSTDTRSLQKGDLYIALKGDSFDGHECLDQAEQAGAVAAIVDKDVHTSLPVIQVEDTRKALGDLAADCRQAFTGKVAAITGSNGKTTVKEMLTAIVAKQGDVVATQGNFNNDIGLPLTILRMQQEAFAVIEMGANHPGEISYLTGIAQPDVVLINNAAQAHLEGFETIKGVAEAKGEIYQGLSADGIAVINKDDVFCDYWKGLLGNKKTIEYSMLDKSADVYAEWQQTELGGKLELNLDGKELTINLKVHGQHNAMNALAAISLAQALKIKSEHVKQALNEFTAVKGRLNFYKVSKGFTVIDDTYNANPTSLSAAIDVLNKLPGEHWLVLGDMGELGSDAQKIHIDVGVDARASGITRLLTIGKASRFAADAFGDKASVFESKKELITFVKQHQSQELTILVKGSRFMRMEQIVESLTKEST